MSSPLAGPALLDQALEVLSVPRCFARDSAEALIARSMSLNGSSPRFVECLHSTSLVQLDVQGNWYLRAEVRGEKLKGLALRPDRLLQLARLVREVLRPSQRGDKTRLLDQGWLEALAREESGYGKLRSLFDDESERNGDHQRVLAVELDLVGPYLTRVGAPATVGFSFLLGTIAYRNKRWDTAKKHLESVVAAHIGDKDEAVSLYLLGQLAARERGLHKEAEKLYKRSLALLSSLRLGDGLDAARVKYSLGVLLSKTRTRRLEAEEHLTDSLSLFEKANQFFWIAQADLALGDLLSGDRARGEDASNYYRDVLEASRGIPHLAIASRCRFASFLAARGRDQEADWLYTDASDRAESLLACGVPLELYVLTDLVNSAPDYLKGKQWIARMREAGITPDVVLFGALVNKAGSYAEAREALTEMRNAGITPDAALYGALVNKAGSYAEAREALTEMRNAGIAPNVVIRRMVGKRGWLNQATSDKLLES